MNAVATLWTQSFLRGIRLLGQDAAFTLLAVVLLAVGQAASIALLAAFDAVIVRPVPYPDPERLAYIWSTRATQNQGVILAYVSAADFRTWLERAHTVRMSALTFAEVNVGGSRIEPELTQGVRVTADLLDLIGVTPALGRSFRQNESHVAIISHDYWQRRFAGATNVIGRTVQIDAEPYTIIGVLPAGMVFFDNIPPVHVYTLLDVSAGGPLDTRGQQRTLVVAARIDERFTLDEAKAEMATIGRQMAREDPANAGMGVRLLSIREHNANFYRNTLLMLLGGGAVLLLTSGLNAAGLLLTRTVSRRSEFGLRVSFGASRGQVIAQVLIECLPLALLSALLAIPIAIALVGGLGTQLPWMLPRHNPFTVNTRVMAIGLGVWMLLTLGMAIPPALHACRVDLIEALGGNTRTGGLRQPSVWGRKLLMVCQIALAAGLLLGAGLLARTSRVMHQRSLGFATDHVITCKIPFPVARYPMPNLDAAPETISDAGLPAALLTADEMLTRVRAVPGVERAGLGSMLPMGYGSWWIRRIATESSRTTPLAQLPTVKVVFAGPDYLDALGVTLRDGRWFSEQDTASSEAVAIVNESFARVLLTPSKAIGARVRVVRPGDAPSDQRDERTIVGTIANISDNRRDRTPEPEIYLPFAQFRGEAWSNILALAIRTSLPDPESLMPTVRQQLQTVDPDQAISQVATPADLLERRIAQTEFNVEAMVVVAVLGVASVSLGIFGVFAYVARLRVMEFAVRVALGARPSQIARDVLVEALWLAGYGLGVGVVAIVLIVPLLQSELLGLAQLDATMVAGAAVLIVLVTFASIVVPARSAARVDATACLR
jgi:putative ABC transport system permease protein